MTLERNQKGFTVLEILVVMVIVGMLSQMSLLNVTGKKQDAEESMIRSDLRNVMIALELYSLDTGAYPDAAGEDPLSALLQPPQGIGGWKGPYLKGFPKRIPRDGYTYSLSGDKKSYTISINWNDKVITSTELTGDG